MILILIEIKIIFVFALNRFYLIQSIERNVSIGGTTNNFVFYFIERVHFI